jgi:hypothetical protein
MRDEGSAMNRIICYSLLSYMLAFPACAGQATIRETDTGIYVEYTPSEEDSKEAQAVREQDEKKKEAEEVVRKKSDEKHERRAKVRSIIDAEGKE